MNQGQPKTAATAPKMLIELIGKMPEEGVFCATCCILYIGAVSADPEVQQGAREAVDRAIEQGEHWVTFLMPEREDKRLRYAVTMAPSVYFTQVMPVCWLHLQGFNPGAPAAKRETSASRLIPGKTHGTEWMKKS